MESQTILSPSNIMFVLGLLGIIFSVFNYFRNPQVDLEKSQALNEERDKNKATTTETSLLNQALNQEKESNNVRFKDLGERIDKSMTLAQNHIHTVDTKVDKLSQEVGGLALQITKLATIIDERMPKKGQ